MDWLPNTNNTLLLDWEDGVPRFVRGKWQGTVLMVDLDCERFDDIFIAETSISIELSLQNECWRAWISHAKKGWRWGFQQTQIYALIEKINEALLTRSDIDLTEYVVEWEKKDTSFYVSVR